MLHSRGFLGIHVLKSKVEFLDLPDVSWQLQVMLALVVEAVQETQDWKA
jgi:hypothetical protein